MKLSCPLAAVLGLTILRGFSATFTVTTIDDSGPGSLRQAILDANTANGDDTITFSVTGTITLASALPQVTGSTTIQGPGTNQLSISGNGSVNIFTFNNGTTNTISDLTIADGMASNYQNGAGIANAGKLTVINCALINNRNFGGWGGAVFNSGVLVIEGSTFLANAVKGGSGLVPGGGGGAGMGGALFTMSKSVSISTCSFASNSATGGNGAEAASNRIGRGGGTNGGVSELNKNGGFGGGGLGLPPYAEGGDGGFGGGGGGSGLGGAGGFGGGAGYGCGSEPGGGGGGAGIGGAIFVHSGSAKIVDCFFVGNQSAGGEGGSGCSHSVAGVGSGFGPDFYNYDGTILPTLKATTLGGGTFITNPVAPPYLDQSFVTVTASPSPGWTFLQWFGDASGTNPTVGLHMNKNRLVEAMFGTPLTHPPTIHVSPATALYPFGTEVRLTAIPPQGTYFVSWNGHARGTNNPTSLVVSSGSPYVDCEFAPLRLGESSLTVVEDGRGQVVVVPAKDHYSINETVGLIPIPESGQDFLGWTGDAGGTQSPLLVSMIQSRFITANFTKRPKLRIGTPLEGTVEEGVRITLLGEFGSRYSILGSTNLLEWVDVLTLTNTYGVTRFIDPATTVLPWRFYRAVGE